MRSDVCSWMCEILNHGNETQLGFLPLWVLAFSHVGVAGMLAGTPRDLADEALECGELSMWTRQPTPR